MNDDYQVTLVPPSEVLRIWPAVEPFVERAVKFTSGKYFADDVRDLVAVQGQSLWVAFNSEGIKGAVITRILDYPRKRYLFLDFCGGVDGFKWKDSMLSILRRWAKDHHCDGIEATGRLGWERIFRSEGYSPQLRNFELPIEAGQE